MGDPEGIGPEITIAAVEHVSRALAAVGPGVPRVSWSLYSREELAGPLAARGDVTMTRPSDGPGGIRDAIERSAADLAARAIDAVVTAPVSKSCFGGDFPGHTELFAARLGVSDYAMMMTGPRLRVVPVTIHVPLADVPRLLTTAELVRVGRLVQRSLLDLGHVGPRIALAGLNPHASDGGLFGDEEARIIAPAVDALRSAGVDASGPWSPDTVYHHAAQGRFDAVLAPYHDQALIPFKLLHFSDGVNVTLGLPRPRTSPDHGPAYDIAGAGRADPTSMIRAIELAVRLAGARSEADP